MKQYITVMMYMKSYSCRLYNFQIRDTNLNESLVCKPYLQFCMAHTLIQIQSYLFIISQPKVSFQYSIYFYTITFIQSHILRLQMGSTTFKHCWEITLHLIW